MCCAIQNSQVEVFYTRDMDEYPELPFHSTRTSHKSIKFDVELKESSSKSTTQRTQDSTVQIETSQTKEEAKRKKKKWKKMSPSDTGFNMSLFPRPSTGKHDPDEEERIARTVELELEKLEWLLRKAGVPQQCAGNDFCDDSHSCEHNFRRRDRHKRVQKAGKQVKDKYCISLKNNDGRKKLFIHHRLFKLINLEERKMTFMPSPKHYTRDIIVNKSTNETRSKLKPHSSADPKPAPVQNLRHTLHETNVPSGMESTLVNLLISLQHRELTPEDYDLLLQLDDSVAPKTIDKSYLSSFRTDTAGEECADDLCPVCMDHYQPGQSRKWLPCNHVFHVTCIDMWLENSSRNCPVDGLPVDQPS